MNQIDVGRVLPNEAKRLQHIGRLTFSETFAAVNTEENMNKYLDEEFALSKLKEELNQKNSEFYFAELGNKLIGYSKINVGQAQTEIRDDKALEIERIYVLHEFHGKNVGKILLEKAIKQAIKRKLDYIWLGVWEENPRAIRFYEKNGFKAFDKHIFTLGDDKQTDILMKLTLQLTDE
jgi:ribosomal protein S18 acetylase RimI-like enzyme